MESGIVIKDKEVLSRIKDYYLSSSNYRDLLLFTLAINTGIKLNDILDLNVGDVRGKTSFRLGSGKIFKQIPLNDELQELISNVCEGREDEEPLFMSSLNRRIERTTVYRNFKDVCRELGLDSEISLASLRKTFGYHYYHSFGDLSLLQWLFNQNTVLETMKYIGISDDLSNRFQSVNL